MLTTKIMFSFDGSAKRGNNISLRGSSIKEDKATLMKKAREERQARQLAKQKKECAALIQVKVNRSKNKTKN